MTIRTLSKQRCRRITLHLASAFAAMICALPQAAQADEVYVALANGFGGGSPGTVAKFTTA